MEIGKRIKEYREKNKITQKDFAQKIGATQSFLSLVENGRVDIETSTMLKKVIDIIGEENTEKKVDKLMGTLEKKVDNVNSPSHYKIPGCNFESIDIIRGRLGDIGFMFFLEGNVTKYLIRAEKKNGKEDYQKAKKYLSWLIDMKKIIPHELALNEKEEIAKRCQSNWLNIMGGITQDMKAKKVLILNGIFNQLFSAKYEEASDLIDKLLKE
jgi:transcriptional regulator with XRE-family HTH domain